MTVKKTRIFSMAALELGEIPITAISQQNTEATTAFEAAWDQFIPQFIESTRLRDFIVEADYATPIADGASHFGGIVSGIVAPDGLEVLFEPSTPTGTTFLMPLEVEFLEERYGSESVRWQYVPVNMFVGGVETIKRCIAVDAASGIRVRQLFQPDDPMDPDDEWGLGNVSAITEKAIALSLAEFLAPARANDELVIRNVQEKARQARLMAKQHSGQVGSRRYRQQSSLITARFTRPGRYRRTW